MENIKELDKQYIANTYGRFDLELVKGEGSLVWDEKGKKYIDLGSGIAVSSFGISDPEWRKAVTAQLDTLSHVSNLYYSIPQVRLAKLLCVKSGMKKVFFANSGAEANECAIKTARKYSSDKYGDDRNVIITLVNSFHGRTITTLAATGQEVFHKSFGPFTEGFVYAHANCYDEIEELCSKYNVCAIMMELVQGEGGVVALDKDFVKKTADLCSAKDYCLIIDEVQTGNGRTGELYAYMNYGIAPDIVSTAKGLAGGLPFGACMMNEKCANVLGRGDHGSTFGGNPICAAGAYSILSRIDDELLAGVRRRSEYIIGRLKGVKGVESVSGLGLMLGIQTTVPATEIAAAAIKNGVIPLTAKNKIRLLPALNIPEDVLAEGMDILIRTIEELS